MHLGLSPGEERVEIPATDLLTHAVILGRTGSGKSGLTIALVEELAKSGASVLVLDPKGDLTNLALSLTSTDDFKHWATNPVEARLKHGEGLASSGLGFDDVQSWRTKVNVSIYAPGKISGGGRSVNVFPTFSPPTKGSFNRSSISRDVAIVLQSLGESYDPFEPALVYLTSAVSIAWEEQRFFPVALWAEALNNPPEKLSTFGGMKLEEFFPKAKRTKLARKLIGFQHAADRWLQGPPLDLRHMVGGSKPEVAVFSMRHLSEEDRQFFTGLLLNKVTEFMFQTESSEKLKLAVVLDEARGYLPPHPQNPVTKAPICTILAQGRAQGIGMVIGTQNPMDLDYKALSNVGTWFVGRLRERDCARDLVNELAQRDVSIEDVADMPQRSFLLLDKRGDHQQFQTRWCLNYLFGPMSGEQLSLLSKPVLYPAQVVRATPVQPSPPPAVVAPRPVFKILPRLQAPPIVLEEVQMPRVVARPRAP
jgi:hypothetical protein